MFFSSKRSRRKWVTRLTSQGVEEVRAHQIAWAAFPFDDSHRPRSREFDKIVRSESFKFVRERDVDGDQGHELAVETLRRWASLAGREDESYYSTLYEMLAAGIVPSKEQVEQELRYRQIQEAGAAARAQMSAEEVAFIESLGDAMLEASNILPAASIPEWMTRETMAQTFPDGKLPKYIEEEFDRREREGTT